MSPCHIPPAGFRGEYRDDALARAVYSEAAGIGRIVPAAVAVPADAGDVATIVRWASERSLSIVPRGSGSSMAGGAIGPGVIVDLSRLDSIDEVNAVEKSVWAGAGALRGTVNRAAVAKGLRFPVDPSSGEFCTVGGMVSTNAAGAHSLRFGATREWVLALDCIFEDGSRAVVKRGVREARTTPGGVAIPALDRFEGNVRDTLGDLGDGVGVHQGVLKESSGYGIAAFSRSGDVVDLLVGSEGTLATIVGVKLALDDLPVASSGILAAFASLDDAVSAAVAARAAGAVACELLDRTFLEVASAGEGPGSPALETVPYGTEALLLAEVEASSVAEAVSAADELAMAFREAGSTLVTVANAAAEQHEIWELRHAASPILARLDPSLMSMQFIEDGAVPPERLAEYVRGVRAAMDSRGIRGVIFGHAGDSHVHVNPLLDVSRPGWRENLEGLLDDVVDLTAALGGTLAGEHGDGRLRTPLLARVWSERSLELFSAVKSAFDPRGILNPGVKIPLPRQKSIADVKYDPSLSPLPTAVRAALDEMTERRAYSSLRLSLLT